jgi:hypothetical protein
MKKHKEKVQAGETLARLNTDDLQDGGLPRSSDEASVMGVERRGQQLDMKFFGQPLKWEDLLLIIN